MKRISIFIFVLFLFVSPVCSATIDVVNEKSTWVLVLFFFDENKQATVPTSVTYRIDDATSGTVILQNTVVVPIGTSYKIIITPVQNSIIDQNNAYEQRRVTVIWQYGSKQGSDEYVYRLKNLANVL